MDILGELETLEPSSATFLVYLTNSSVIRGARVGKGCKGGERGARVGRYGVP